MFIHSVRVPRLYKNASKIVQQVKENGASLKDLLYKKKHPNLKGIYSLVLTVLKNADKLDYIIRSTQILIKENRLDPWLARVLITELFWGKCRLNGECKPFQTVLSYKTQLTDSLKTFQDVNVPRKAQKVHKPRYVRVNTIKISIPETVEIFRDEGWTLVKCGNNSDYAAFSATVASLSEDQFIIDIHIKELLVFPPKTEFYQHHLYLNGSIVLQDKASCLVPVLLAPPSNASVLDMCSAPGMKTSQLAAQIGLNGKIYAVERDQRRYETLCKLISQMGIANVQCINKDVLTLTAKEFPDVEYILVDPSCSGSGMLDRLEFENPESKCNKSRLQSLAGFQITILRHALMNFPKAKRVIYSTCSLYSEENEEVVHQVITSVNNFKLVNLRDKMKSKWFNFGSDDFGELGQSCLYAKPDQDLTNGFFMAMFERIQSDEINKYFVKQVRRTSECENVHKNSEQNKVKENDEFKNGKKRRIRSKPEFTNDNAGNIVNDSQSTQNDELDSVNVNQIAINEAMGSKRKKKQKNKNAKHSVGILESNEEATETNTPMARINKKKKNKSKKREDDEDIKESIKQEEIDNRNMKEVTKKCKKSKKEKSKVEYNDNKICNEILQTREKEKLKKRKRKNSDSYKTIIDNNTDETGGKKHR